MIIRDDIARIILEDVRQDIRNGNDYTRPWLDLDVPAFADYRDGKTATLPAPYDSDPVDQMMMTGVQGMKVLCLAGGGGQQSAVFSLLGADVTVLDLCPEQLTADEQAADHYGYNVTTIQADMRDLSALPEAGFDRVYQPISTLFIPDLREVFSGVSRILKPGGLYSADYATPLLYLAEDKGWDGEGYNLRITQPYESGAILETADGRLNFVKGESCSEFHHRYSDIVNGLIAEGLTIRGLWENPRPGHKTNPDDLTPDSDEHRERFLPYGLTIITTKGGS